MPLEIEAKIKVVSHADVRARLQTLGARFVARVLETNHIFDNADRTLLNSGCGLRIRACRVLEGEAPPATLTYKGPRQPGPLKKREEINLRIEDADSGCELLKRLGYVEVLCFEKRRETWRLGDCQIELDEVPYLGAYIEIEGPHEAAIQDAQAALGLADQPNIRATYIALLVKHCKRHHLPADRIAFDNPGP